MPRRDRKSQGSQHNNIALAGTDRNWGQSHIAQIFFACLACMRASIGTNDSMWTPVQQAHVSQCSKSFRAAHRGGGSI